MATLDDNWAAGVARAVRGGYPDTRLLLVSPGAGNTILQLDAHTMFKALRSETDPLSQQEESMTTLLRLACGATYHRVFIPLTPTPIGGYADFASPRFGATLLDLVLDPSVSAAELETRLIGVLDNVFARLGLLGELTCAARDPHFPQELRLTFEFIALELSGCGVARLDLLDMIVRRVEDLVPVEGTWCVRDNSLENVTFLDGQWLLFDPFPTLELTPRYVECMVPLRPPFKGHLLLDHAKILVSIEREAGKLINTDRSGPMMCTDRRAPLDRGTQIEHHDLLLRVKDLYEKRATAAAGLSALYVGYVIWYGLYSGCKCRECQARGVWDIVRAGLERSLHQLADDGLAGAISNAPSLPPGRPQ